MATLNGEWSLTTKSTGTTASYKIGTKEVVKLTNLNSSITKNADGTLPGVTVTEDESTGNKITLSESALGTANVAFTSSTYTLELDDKVPQEVEIKDVKMTVASGKATVTGTLTKAYTLAANGKTVTYSAEKTGQELATISNLSTDASTSNVVLGDDTITLSNASLKAASPKLTLKNGAAYTLALNSDVTLAKSTVTGVTTSKGTATIKGTVDTAGYSVSGDGKTVYYVKATTKEGTLATVKNLKTDATLSKSDIQTQDTSDGSYSVKISESLLNGKDVTISSTAGYKLELDGSYSKPSAYDEWSVNKTTATYKQVQPAYYEYDGTKIAYNKDADVQTYATLKGLVSELTPNGDNLNDSTGATAATLSNGVITLKQGALTTTNVTLTSDDYTLALDSSVTNPTVDTDTALTWTVSKDTATVKGKTTAGWGQKDSKTVTYAKAANSSVLATIAGIKSGLKATDLTGIEVDNKSSTKTVTLPGELLNGQNVTLTPGDGFSYDLKLAKDVTQEAVTGHFWEATKDETKGVTTGKLYRGTKDYYTASGSTVTYHPADKGSKVATVENFAADLTNDDLDENISVSDYDNKTKAYTITLSEPVLGGKTITVTGTNYKLALDDPTGLAVQTGRTTWEKDDDTTATFYEYNTEGYAADSKGTQIVYTAARKGATLGTVTGLKKGFVVDENGSIEGLTGYAKETVISEETVVDGETIPAKVIPAKTIVIDKPVVGTTNIELDSDKGYQLAIGDTLDEATPDPSWEVKSNSAVYTVITPAGYSLTDNNTVFVPTKASKTTVTLTGLGTTEKTEIEAGIVVDDSEKTMTLDSSVLGQQNVTAKGGYTLKLATGVPAPTLSDSNWDMSKKGTAVLKATITDEGWTASGSTIAYTPEKNEESTLATVSGLNTAAGASSDGIEEEDGVITLSSNVLGTSKVSVKGDGYSLALGEGVPTESENKTEWVLKGTTATFQNYDKGFYSIDKTGAIVYNKDGKATVHATVSGLTKITDDNKDAVNEAISIDGTTIILGADALGTSKVTLKNGKDSEGNATSYKLALGSDVPTKVEEGVKEWVSNGTKITYQQYDKGFYTLDSNGTNITFAKDTNVKALLTISGNGLVSGAEVANFDEKNNLIYLGEAQLSTAKNKATVTLKTSTGYENYKLALVTDENDSNAVAVPDPETSVDWYVESGSKTATATYTQTVGDEEFICDGTTITYYQEGDDITLATLTGLNNNIYSSDFGDVTVKNGVITLTKDVLSTEEDYTSAKVAVKEKGYTLALDKKVATPTQGDPEWNFDNISKGNATYVATITEGYTLNEKDKRSITYSAKKEDSVLATLSGLNKNYTVTGTTAEAQATAAGLRVDENGVITLSNKDLLTTSKVSVKGTGYTLAIDESLEPQPLEKDTAVWTVKGTTATLNLGTSSGYSLDAKGTSATYIKENASTPIATLTNLGKSLKVDNGKVGTIGSDKNFVQGIFMRDGDQIALTPDVLGTTTVTLTNESGYNYTIADENFKTPDIGSEIWSYDASKGTATLTQTTTEGWTLDSNKTTLTYTPNRVNATIATISGLSKTFEGDIDKAVDVSGGTITVNSEKLLGTSKVTLKGDGYSLALGDVTKTNTEITGWLTSGTKATYKTYNQAYYALENGAIVYKKAVDVKNSTKAEISGIAKDKDVDINECESDGVITLGADQLGTSAVTLKDTAKEGYKLVLGDDAPTPTPEATANWVTKGTTANLQTTISAGFTQASDLKFNYSKANSAAVIAVIKGVVSGAMNGDSLPTSTTTISPATSNLSSAVTIDGKETYAFSFASDYSGKITGAATADTINAGGAVNIVSGKGNDVITVSGAGATVATADGNDTINVTGGSASINAGKGDDSIKSGGNGNTFFYAKGDGDDVIVNFSPTKDEIQTSSKKATVAKDGNNAVVTIDGGTITLTGKGSAIASISVVDSKDNELNTLKSASSDDLLADDNYSQDAAAVTDITDAFHASYTPYDFEAGLDLVKKDSFAPAVTYMGDDK